MRGAKITREIVFVYMGVLYQKVKWQNYVGIWVIQMLNRTDLQIDCHI